MDTMTMIKAAEELARKLQRALDDPSAEHVTLDRDEALLAQGLLEGLREVLVREQQADSALQMDPVDDLTAKRMAARREKELSWLEQQVEALNEGLHE